MLRCGRCEQILPLEAFAPSKRLNNGNHCRDCTREYRRLWKQTPVGQLQREKDRRLHRERHPEQYRLRGAKSGKKRVIQGRELVRAEKLRRQACVDCGFVVTEDNLVAFDFDHRDRSLKKGQISDFIARPWALADELAKCDLRCANCHRIKTYRASEWTPLSALAAVASPELLDAPEPMAALF